MDATELDGWRWEQANKRRDVAGPIWTNDWKVACIEARKTAEEYRRLVREDVQPPAEPDQDTLDTRAVLEHMFDFDELDGNLKTHWPEFEDAKAALSQIKDRVRKEAIQALPDEPTEELWLAAVDVDICTNEQFRGVIAAIKQVFGT